MLDLTIKMRLQILGLIAILGLILASVFSIVQLSRLSDYSSRNVTEIAEGMSIAMDVSQINTEFKIQIQEWKNLLIRGNKAEYFTQYEKAFLKSEATVQEQLKKTLDAIRKQNDSGKAEIIAKLESLVRSHAEMGREYKAALALFDRADPEAGKKVDLAVKGKDRETTDALNNIADVLETEEFSHLKRQIESGQEQYLSSRNILLEMVAVVLAVVIGIVVVTVRMISGQIAAVQRATAEVKSSLDLTLRIPVSGNTEMGQVAGAFNGLLDEFQAIVRRMIESGRSVSQTSENLSLSVGQLAAAVEQQNEATASMAASVEQMTVSVTHMSGSAKDAHGFAQKSLTMAEQGGNAINKTATDMVAMAGSVQSTSRTMEELNKRTESIGSIAGVIKEIADQTNLLALNAAIEAARAGEQGRGFAVVADEVRKLAERTTTATGEIAAVIGSIQLETHKAVTEMHRIVEQVSVNADSARQAGKSIELIRDGSLQVVAASSDISNALSEQSAASELIAQEVERIAEMSEENSSAMNQAKHSSDEMKSLATGMHDMVSRFTA